MKRAGLSILGLYNYDNTIFDQLSLPIGIDKQTIIDNLCFELADFDVLYPDPDILKYAIGAWSNARLDSWKRILSALEESYSPLHNYDRNETYEESENSSTTGISSGSVNGNSDNSAASYDAADLQKITSNTQSTTNTNSAESATTGARKHTAHMYGNIGVTTSQYMLREEIGLRKEFDFDKIIVDEFKQRFCVMVY